MTTRLQEPLQKLELSDKNEAVVKYLAVYVIKEKLPRIVSDADNSLLLALSLDSLKCRKWNVQDGNLIGIVKEEFSSNSGTKKHSSASTSSSSSSKKNQAVEFPRFTSNYLVNESFCFWVYQMPPASIREKVMFGIQCFNATFNEAPDQIMPCVKRQLEFIIEHEGCPRPPLPTSRALYYTDIVYLKENEFQKYAAVYLKLGCMLADNVEPDKVFNVVEDEPRLLVFSLYMFEYLCLYVKASSYPQCTMNIEGTMMLRGCQLLIDSISSLDSNFQKIAELFASSVPVIKKRSIEAKVIAKDIVNTPIEVMVMLLKSIMNYEDIMLKDEERENELIEFLVFHPIYALLSFVSMFIHKD